MASEWNKLTVNQLKIELTQRGLENTGKKADLVSRLEQYEKEKSEEITTNDQDINEQIDEITKDASADIDQDNAVEETMEEDGAQQTADEDKPEKEDQEKEGKENEEHMEEDQKEVKEDETAEAKNENQAKEMGECEETEAQEGEHTGEDAASEKKEGDQTETKEEEEVKEEDKGEEGAVKDEEEKKEQEFYDYTKNATGFILALDNGRKIVIPSKDVLKTDLLCCNQPKTVWVYPISVQDITSGLFNEFMNSCIHFHITFHENDNDRDKSERGYAEFIFLTETEATEQAEKLKQTREGLTVRQLTLRDKRAEILNDLPMEVLNEDLLLKRYLYIGNLPPTATSQALQELFPDAKRLAVITNEDGLPKGYALAEMPSEEGADRATKMYMNVSFEDCNLVVLRAWQKIPKGLLDHDTRVELLKTVKRDRLKLRGRNVDITTRRKLESEMTLSKQRLDKDCKLREELGLPAPPDIVRREELMKEKRNEDADGDGDKKTTPKKFNRTSSAPYRKPQGGRGGRSRGVPSLIRGGGRFGNRGGYGGTGYGNQDYYDDGGYSAGGMGGSAGDGNYNQAVQMLMQVSKMLGTTGSQGGGSYRGGAGGFGASNYSSGGYSGGYGGSGYSGYGGTRKRYAEDDGFGGVNKRGPGARNQRRW